ncbi:hypothetical protein [Nostoc commune]|uniref:hypothetical protein n=1 Tax=Nostoc commune TaxID=1178 RepID=UPI003969E4FB
MEEFIGTNSLEYAPVVMSGMASIFKCTCLCTSPSSYFQYAADVTGLCNAPIS